MKKKILALLLSCFAFGQQVQGSNGRDENVQHVFEHENKLDASNYTYFGGKNKLNTKSFNDNNPNHEAQFMQGLELCLTDSFGSNLSRAQNILKQAAEGKIDSGCDNTVDPFASRLLYCFFLKGGFGFEVNQTSADYYFTRLKLLDSVNYENYNKAFIYLIEDFSDVLRKNKSLTKELTLNFYEIFGIERDMERDLNRGIEWDSSKYNYHNRNRHRFDPKCFNGGKPNKKALLMQGLELCFTYKKNNFLSKTSKLISKKEPKFFNLQQVLIKAASGEATVDLLSKNTCDKFACLLVSCCYLKGAYGFPIDEEVSEFYLKKSGVQSIQKTSCIEEFIKLTEEFGFVLKSTNRLTHELTLDFYQIFGVKRNEEKKEEKNEKAEVKKAKLFTPLDLSKTNGLKGKLNTPPNSYRERSDGMESSNVVINRGEKHQEQFKTTSKKDSTYTKKRRSSLIELISERAPLKIDPPEGSSADSEE